MTEWLPSRLSRDGGDWNGRSQKIEGHSSIKLVDISCISQSHKIFLTPGFLSFLAPTTPCHALRGKRVLTIQCCSLQCFAFVSILRSCHQYLSCLCGEPWGAAPGLWVSLRRIVITSLRYLCVSSRCLFLWRHFCLLDDEDADFDTPRAGPLVFEFAVRDTV